MEKGQTTKSYTKEERATLIALWKESGKSKVDFCKEFAINYQTFMWWTNPPKSQKKQNISFVPLQIKQEVSNIFAEVQFERGAKICFHREVSATFLRSLVG